MELNLNRSGMCVPHSYCEFNSGDFRFYPGRKYKYAPSARNHNVKILYGHGYIYLKEEEFNEHFKVVQEGWA